MSGADLKPAMMEPGATAQPVSGFAKKPVAAGANRVAELTRAMVRVKVAPSAVPLDLAPLLSPYEGYKHLSLRVERLPTRARLSKGRNNGDRTWSLTLDELDGLVYVPPEGMAEAHSLAIRIISLDDDYGATLAVLDFPVSCGDATPGSPPDAIATPDGAADLVADAELRRLRNELAAMQAALADRGTELSAARTARDAELEGRIAEATAEAAANLEQSRAAWQAEQEDRLAKSEARAQERIEQAHDLWQQATTAALSNAEQAWKVDEAVRLAAVEAHWREQSAQALAAAAARSERAETALAEMRAQADVELRCQRGELTATQAALADRVAELAQAHSATEQARERWQQAATAALSNAEQAWKADEAVRLAAAEARWRKQSARALADTTVRSERAEAALAEMRAQADVELRSLRGELTATQAALADRAAELAETRQKLKHVGAERSEQAIEAALTAARSAWEAELEERLAKAKAEAAANLEESRAAWQAEQDDRFARSEELARERSEQAHEWWQQATAAAVSNAEDAWKQNEAARLAAAEARWREQSARALTEATARFERAEAALAQARAKAEAARDTGADVEQRRLRDELAAMQAALVNREAELAEMRQRLEHTWAERSKQRIESALTAARSTWEAELEERLAEAAAEAAANLEKSRATWQTEQDGRAARSEGRAQERIEQARERWEEETRAALSNAAEAWRADEAVRLAAAEAQWREQSALALAKATARFERAEAALAEVRTEAEAARDPAADVERRCLRDKLAAMEAALADREAEVAQARSSAKQARERWTLEAQATLEKAEEAWKAEEAQRLLAARAEWQKTVPVANTKSAFSKVIDRQRQADIARRLIRGGVLAACLAAAAVAAAVFYPRVEPMIVDRWWPKIDQLIATAIEPFRGRAGAPTEAQLPVPERAHVAERRAIIGVSSAKVRAGPSTETAVITTLPRDKEVTPVERRGYWVLVRIGGEDGKHKQEGWVYGSFLNDFDSR
ncbi:MAG TPA: SH3 domain-containing protein [Stellaceae bacterium]|nr:SH3 domain-containing protein [Stellaceae bacterium]